MLQVPHELLEIGDPGRHLIGELLDWHYFPTDAPIIPESPNQFLDDSNLVLQVNVKRPLALVGFSQLVWRRSDEKGDLIGAGGPALRAALPPAYPEEYIPARFWGCTTLAPARVALGCQRAKKSTDPSFPPNRAGKGAAPANPSGSMFGRKPQ